MNRNNGTRTSDIVILAAISAGLCAAGAMHWWHVIGQREPFYFTIARALVGLSGIAVLFTIFARRWRSRVIPAAGLAAVLLPLLAVQVVVTHDAKSMYYVAMQTQQLSWLLITLRQTERLPYVPWTEPDWTKTSTAVRANVYNITDGIEAAPAFAGLGWYASLALGVCVCAFSCLRYRRRVRVTLIRYRIVGILAVLALTLILYGNLFVAFVYWNRARAAGATGDYAAAVDYDRQVVRWDPRWNDDLLYHFELGRFYGHLGLTHEPDYWAYVADSLTNSGQVQQALQVYREHFPVGRLQGEMRDRYVHALILAGSDDFVNGRYGVAADHWTTAAHADENDVEALYFAATGLTKIRHYAEAIPVWKALITKNESVGLFRYKYVASRLYRKQITSRAWVSLAWCYFQLHDYDSAIQCRDNLRQANPTDAAKLPDPGDAEGRSQTVAE